MGCFFLTEFLSWILDYIIIPLLIYVIKLGPIPKHVAFIMDGNRRWSKQEKSNQTDKEIGFGHRHGYMALERVCTLVILLYYLCRF